MFRQIRVAGHDRDLQRIVWADDRSAEPIDYRLTTVTYGTACAPYLALRTLQQLAQDEEKQFPLGSRCLQSDTYVDDVFTGADDIVAPREIQDQLIGLLRTAEIELDNWAANCDELLPCTALAKDERPRKLIKQDGPIKTLGVCWDMSADRFVFCPGSNDISNDIDTRAWTKRLVLSEIARLFDPLGWLAPIIIIARILMQDICLINLEWDAPLPPEMHQRWTNYRASFIELPTLSIDRWLGTVGKQNLQIHGFSDASKRAYAAAVYLRVTAKDGSIRVSLLAAKTRVAPVKTTSIPNLELCGAGLLTDLIVQLMQLEWLEPLSVFLWTDSEIVLAWLDKHPTQWKTFVANRVSRIQTTLPAARWSHLPTKDNPADIASRGVGPAELSTAAL